jgi:choline kinase
VPLHGKALLDHQLDAFGAVGVEDVVVIRGYRAATLARADVRTIDNPDYETNNILLSMLYASAELDGPAYVTYGDIVFARDVVSGLAGTPGDIVLVVDRRWLDAYDGRTDHPPSEAELCHVAGDRVVRVGKGSGEAGAHGEFIGLCKLSAQGAAIVRDAGLGLRATFAGREDDPYGRSTFRKAYLCDLFNDLIARGVTISHHDIDGHWREIDTPQDYARAQAITFLGIPPGTGGF